MFVRGGPRAVPSPLALCVAVLPVLVDPGVAEAGPAPGLSALEVALWPEYDRPEVLVILRARLDSAVSLPASVRLPMPAAVAMPHAVAFQAAGGALLVANYTREVEQETAWIKIVAETRDIQLEYYDPLSRSGDFRAYTWRWPGGLAVAEASYEIQLPAASTAVTLVPTAARCEQPSAERSVCVASLGAWAVGDTPTIELGYAGPSGSTIPARALDADRPSSTAWVWWVLGAAVALFIVSLVLLARSRRGPGRSSG